MTRLILVAHSKPTASATEDAVLKAVWEKVSPSKHSKKRVKSIAEINTAIKAEQGLTELVIIGHGTPGLIQLAQANTSQRIRWQPPSVNTQPGKLIWQLIPSDKLGTVKITLIGCSTGGDSLGNKTYQEGPELCHELQLLCAAVSAPVCGVSVAEVTVDGDYTGSPLTNDSNRSTSPPRKTPLATAECTNSTWSLAAKPYAKKARGAFCTLFPEAKSMWPDVSPVVELNEYLAAATIAVKVPQPPPAVPVTFMLLDFSGRSFLAVRWRPDALPAIVLTEHQRAALHKALLHKRKELRTAHTPGTQSD